MQQKVKQLLPTQRELPVPNTDACGKGSLLASSRVLVRAPLVYKYIGVPKVIESVEYKNSSQYFLVLALSSVVYARFGPHHT